MIDLFLRAADRNAMLAGLRAAGFTAEVPADDAPDDALAVTTEEGDPPAEVTRYYVPVTASHAHSLVMPVTVVVTPAVIAADGTVVDPAVLDARYHAQSAPSRMPARARRAASVPLGVISHAAAA